MPSEKMTNKERCEKMYKSYHAKFPDVETLTSEDYLLSLSDYPILVDVRSKAEQIVSMIPGAITLAEFESRMKDKEGEDKGDPSRTTSPNFTTTVVVTYCTIGYRSGVEARRLRDTYKCQVLNLDGIVNYTHACAAAADDDGSNNNSRLMDTTTTSSHPPTPTFLIEKGTKKPTRRVHVFGPEWNLCDDRLFEVVYFSKLDMALRGAGVVARGLFQRIFIPRK